MIQRKEHRFRKGAVIVVATTHSYHTQQPYMGRVEYSQVRLDRILATVPDAQLGRRITKTERLGSIGGSNATLLTLDKDIRADDLWSDHGETVWRSLAEAREVITRYVEVPA